MERKNQIYKPDIESVLFNNGIFYQVLVYPADDGGEALGLCHAAERGESAGIKEEVLHEEQTEEGCPGCGHIGETG